MRVSMKMTVADSYFGRLKFGVATAKRLKGYLFTRKGFKDETHGSP